MRCRYLFQAQYPVHQFPGIRFGDTHGFVGGHRDIAPYAGAAFQHFFDQFVRGILLSGVFLRDILVGWADFFGVYFVAGEAAFDVGQGLLVGGLGGRQGEHTEECKQEWVEAVHGWAFWV